MVNGGLVNGDLANGAGDTGSALGLYADGFAVVAEWHGTGGFTGDLVADGFAVEAELHGTFGFTETLVADGFAVEAVLYGGGDLVADGFAVEADIHATAPGAGNLVADGFSVEAELHGFRVAQGDLSADGFSVEAILYGGGALVADGFSVEAELHGFAAAYGHLVADGFAVEAELHGFRVAQGALSADGFAVEAVLYGGGDWAADGFAVEAALTGDTPGNRYNADLNDSATVLNVATAETTRWTNLKGLGLVRVGEETYLARHDGLYLFSADIGADTEADGSFAEINGTAVTKNTDYGVYNSKCLQYVYADSDNPGRLKVTPYYDGVEKLPHTSRYNDRKVQMAKGVSGRYVQLKVEHIRELSGLEHLYSVRQRRVY